MDIKISEKLKDQVLLCEQQTKKMLEEIIKFKENMQKKDLDYYAQFGNRSQLKSRVHQLRKDLLELKKELYDYKNY